MTTLVQIQKAYNAAKSKFPKFFKHDVSTLSSLKENLKGKKFQDVLSEIKSWKNVDIWIASLQDEDKKIISDFLSLVENYCSSKSISNIDYVIDLKKKFQMKK